jgi:hypothetical protein
MGVVQLASAFAWAGVAVAWTVKAEAVMVGNVKL